MSDAIVIVEYNPAWPSEFVRLRDRAQAALGDVAVAIEHVGSTAVPGLPAKDLIDMVVVVESDEDVDEAIARLAAIGYRARGNLGVEGREGSTRGSVMLGCAIVDECPPSGSEIVLESDDTEALVDVRAWLGTAAREARTSVGTRPTAASAHSQAGG